MTKEKLQAVLDKLPAGALIYIGQGDNAWPAKPRRFSERGDDVVLYLTPVVEDEDGGHRNFPLGYAGVKELKIRT